MNKSLLSSRYATALLEFAYDIQAEDFVFEKMKLISELLNTVPGIKRTLADPVLSDDIKLNLLTDMIKEDEKDIFSRFFSL